MDVSSKYFSLLRTPDRHTIRHIWSFLVDIQRVGKTRELTSFIVWEVAHWLHLYEFGNRYIHFTNHTYRSISSNSTSAGVAPITSAFLSENGLSFQPVTIDWKFCQQTAEGVWWGTRFSQPNALYRSDDQSRSASFVYEFNNPIASLFISRQNRLFVCVHGRVYKSDDQGRSFNPVLQFSSGISYFLFNNGMTQLPDDSLLIGEYGSIWQGKSWQNLAFLYASTDGGNNWERSDFLIQQGVNKHIHLVKYTALFQAVFLTDGDNKKQLWMNPIWEASRLKPGYQQTAWRLLTKYHHQTGGYLSMAETQEGVLFGSDYLGGTNFIVKTTDGRHFQKLVLPDPYRRSPVMNMLTRHTASGTEIWAASYSCLSDKARSLIMCTRDTGKTWTRVLDFDGTRHEVRFVNTSLNPSDDLFISITEFGDDQTSHRHQVYRLMPG